MHTNLLPIIKNKYTQIFAQQLYPTSAQEQTEKINNRAYILFCISLFQLGPSGSRYIYIYKYTLYMYIAYI